MHNRSMDKPAIDVPCPRVSPEELLGPAGSVVSRVFRLMEVAEEVLAEGEEPPEVFPLLQPGELVGFGDELYRAHCREVVRRVRLGEDPSPATDAELVAAYSRMSLAAPLNSEAAAAYGMLFSRVFPGVDVGQQTREAWPGQAEEDVGHLRRKLRQEWRSLRGG